MSCARPLVGTGRDLSARWLKDETGTINIATANPDADSFRNDDRCTIGQVATCPYETSYQKAQLLPEQVGNLSAIG